MSANTLIDGIIVKSIAGFCYVEAGNEIYECKPRGSFRKDNISPIAGDKVSIIVDGNKGTVEKIFERKNFLIRPPLANLDKLFIVSSASVPNVNTLLIDRMIAICENIGVIPIIVFNKSDIGDFGDVPESYMKIGYKTFVVSAKNGDGISQIKEEIKDCVSAFSGNSGVGKSSILNMLLPSANLSVGDVSEKLGRGKHTTRHVELLKCNNGYVADTPGFSSLDLLDFNFNNKDNLKLCFKEFKPFLDKCKFNDCSHVSELGCAVIEAKNNGNIPLFRHENYISMYNDLKQIKSWELKHR